MVDNNEIIKINNNSYLIFEKNMFNYDHLSELIKISTMTITCKLNKQFKLKNDIFENIIFSYDNLNCVKFYGDIKINNLLFTNDDLKELKNTFLEDENILFFDNCILIKKESKYDFKNCKNKKFIDVLKKIKHKNNSNKFFNQMTIIIDIHTNPNRKNSYIIKKAQNKKINVKIFNNGSIHIVGCKTFLNFINTIEMLAVLLDKCVRKKEIINFDDNLIFKNVNIEMINSHYKIKLFENNYGIKSRINREKLDDLLKKNGYVTKYDPDSYSGVKVNYLMADDNNKNLNFNQLKKKFSKIAIFDSGNILINTKNFNDIKNSFDFINFFLKKHYEEIIIIDLNL